MLKYFINAKNDEGFTAMHFSSFKGNINLLEILWQKGGDFNLVNNNGVNIFHIAA